MPGWLRQPACLGGTPHPNVAPTTYVSGLARDYQCQQAGTEQSDARERNGQKGKRCKFFTHGTTFTHCTIGIGLTTLRPS
jgi:hypothetical protein